MVNESEKTVAEKYVEEGYLIISSGWPDIVAIKTHKSYIEMIVDEVKTVSLTGKQPFQKNQKRAAAILKKLEGKPVYITYKSSEVSSNYVPRRTPVTDRKHGVSQFIEKYTEIDFTGIIPKNELYIKYHEYCNTHNNVPLTKGSFSRALNQLIIIATTRRTIDGIRTWCWAGIKLKETSESNENQS